MTINRRSWFSTSTLRCPHCQALDFQRTDPDSWDRECFTCGFTGTCATCGEKYSPEDSQWAQACSQECADIQADEARGEGQLDDWRTG